MRRFCRRQGCATLVDKGYCDAHSTVARDQQAPLDPRYWSAAWRRYSAAYLAEHVTCATCGRLSEVVDHVVPVAKAPERFFDETNHQALCRSCNTRKGGS